jgi:hypothetical protein
MGATNKTTLKKEEQILGEGVVKAKQSCKNLGMSFVKIDNEHLLVSLIYV